MDSLSILPLGGKDYPVTTLNPLIKLTFCLVLCDAQSAATELYHSSLTKVELESLLFASNETSPRKKTNDRAALLHEIKSVKLLA